MHLYCPEIHLTSISICLEADSLQANLICVKNAYNHAGYTSSKQIKKPILRIEVPFWELKSHNHYSLLKYYLNLSVTVSCLPSNIVLPFTKFNEINKYFTAESWIQIRNRFQKMENCDAFLCRNQKLWLCSAASTWTKLHWKWWATETTVNPKQKASSCFKSINGANRSKLTDHQNPRTYIDSKFLHTRQSGPIA